MRKAPILIVLSIAAILLTASITSCSGSSDTSDPKAVSKNAIHALFAGDWNSLAENGSVQWRDCLQGREDCSENYWTGDFAGSIKTSSRTRPASCPPASRHPQVPGHK